MLTEVEDPESLLVSLPTPASENTTRCWSPELTSSATSTWSDRGIIWQSRATDTAVKRLSPVTMTQRISASDNWRITGSDSGLRVFCITKNPRNFKSDSTSARFIFWIATQLTLLNNVFKCQFIALPCSVVPSLWNVGLLSTQILSPIQIHHYMSLTIWSHFSCQVPLQQDQLHEIHLLSTFPVVDENFQELTQEHRVFLISQVLPKNKLFYILLDPWTFRKGRDLHYSVLNSQMSWVVSLTKVQSRLRALPYLVFQGWTTQIINLYADISMYLGVNCKIFAS